MPAPYREPVAPRDAFESALLLVILTRRAMLEHLARGIDPRGATEDDAILFEGQRGENEREFHQARRDALVLLRAAKPEEVPV